MDSSRTLILECGINRVSLAVFSRRGQRIRLNYFATQILAPNAAGESEVHWLAQVRAGFQALAAGTKLRGSVSLLLPAHLTLTKALKIPRVDALQREKLIAFEAAQTIPYALADVVWDWVVVGETAKESEVLIATAKNDMLESLWGFASEVGLAPRAILPTPFATVAGFRLIQGAEIEQFLGLNIGAHSTTLVQVAADGFAMRTFGLNLDPALVRATAEPEESTAALEPIKARLLQEITRSLLHFQSRSSLAKPKRVWLTGEGASLAGFADALRLKLGTPVEMPDLLRAIDIADHEVARTAMAQSAAFLDLIGAAATQLFANQAVVNLLPSRVHQLTNNRRRRPWLVAAALLTLGVVLPPLIHFRQLQIETVKKTAAIERELAPLRIRSAANQVELQQVEAWREQIKIIEAVRERRTRWLRFLVSLQASLDEVGDVWLEKLQPAPTTGAAPTRWLITGRMLDRAHPLAKVSAATFDRVKTFLARVKASPFVAEVESEHFDNHQPGILKFDFILVTDESRSL